MRVPNINILGRHLLKKKLQRQQTIFRGKPNVERLNASLDEAHRVTGGLKKIKFREKIPGVTYSKFNNLLSTELKLFFSSYIHM